MIQITGISKSFQISGKVRQILQGVSFEISAGEVISLVGSNGSGKSTLMRVVAGLLEPDAGKVKIRSDREFKPVVSLTHQSYRDSLFPWRTARENIALAFETNFGKPVPQGEIKTRVDRIMERLHISYLSQQRAPSMSGGQAQMVAIARSLVHPQTALLLLDEPFSALDGRNLEIAAKEVVAVTRENGIATMVITHDLDVGILVGDRIAVLNTEIRGLSSVIEAPTESRFDPDFLVDERFLQCKKDVLAALYPGGGKS